MVAANELEQKAGTHGAPAYRQFARRRRLNAVWQFHGELQAPSNSVLEIQACRFSVRRAPAVAPPHSLHGKLHLTLFLAADSFRQEELLDVLRKNILRRLGGLGTWSLARQRRLLRVTVDPQAGRRPISQLFRPIRLSADADSQKRLLSVVYATVTG